MRVPHFAQNPCPSANGLPQFRQNEAMLCPLNQRAVWAAANLRSILTEKSAHNQHGVLRP